MLLSVTNRRFEATQAAGFIPKTIDPENKEELLSVFRNDWSPFVFKNNYRASWAFESCECLFSDVDNTGEHKCSIADFQAIFPDTHWILSTSRNHGKEKLSGKDKNVFPPADRFHVVFPLRYGIDKSEEVQAALRALVGKYKFFDQAVSGPAQLVFANPETDVIINHGKPLDLEKLTTEKIEAPRNATKRENLTTVAFSGDDALNIPENRIKLLRALSCASQAGAFDSYSDWISLGMGLKAAGFSAQDFASLSWEDSINDAFYKFEGFHPDQISIGTLFHYAKQYAEINIKSPETIARIAEGDAIFRSWQESAETELAKKLMDKKPSVKAGGPPENLIPPSGLIRELYDYIMATSIRKLPHLAIASATALIGVLAGQKFRGETNLRTNLYFVGLAESGSGKEHARRILKNIVYDLEIERYIGGGSIASGSGLLSSMDEHPARLFFLDEFGLMLQGMNGRNAGSYQRDIMTKLMELYSAAGSVYHGVEYADKNLRKRKDIRDPCCCVYATSTHSTFYAGLNSTDGESGFLSRLLVINEPESRPARETNILTKPLAASIMEKINALANYQPLGGGNLAKFTPEVVVMIPEVRSALYDFDDSLTERMTDSVTRSVYSRVAENAEKLAIVYAISRDMRNPVIDEEAFSWGRDLALWSANTLMEQMNRFVANSEHEKELLFVLDQIRKGGKKGLTKTELTTKTRRLDGRKRGDILTQLVESCDIFQGQREGDGMVKKTVPVFIHSDFFHENESKKD